MVNNICKTIKVLSQTHNTNSTIPYSVILSWYALIQALGLNANALSRATAALDFPTCCL